MLEDDFTHVLRKALVGNGLAPTEAAEAAGLEETDVLSLLRGRFSKEVAEKLAPALGLRASAFASHPEFVPAAFDLPWIERIVLPFGQDHVNVWLVRHGRAALLIDAGYAAADLLRALERRGVHLPGKVFITHSHRDHTGGVQKLVAAGVSVFSADIPDALPMKPGECTFSHALTVGAVDLSGHAVPALGFQIDGLGVPVLAVGDAVFAGSIGGCPTPGIYQKALANIHAVLDPMPDETVLLTGHGPGTTLGEERAHNPFL
ncbi:MAG: MBL fold metallo-hydrolase [Akkermansiaceae bacterium]|nr:MBL fold metallo-hydrolase [Akkermansiaceae bacterium]